jgi:putative ABC transport system permease protein
MQRLFGVPLGSLAVGLVVVVGAAVAVITTLALRNRVFLRLGVRNVRRRPGRSALIVVGLMLATAIIAAALGTGDTMGRTVRGSVVRALGNSDEWVTARGVKAAADGELGSSTGLRKFDASVVPVVDRALQGSGLTDGVMPAIVRTVAVQDQTSRRTEPRVTVFAPDPSRLTGFGTIRDTSTGRALELASVTPGTVLLDTRGAEALGAHAGDSIVVLAGSARVPLRVAAVVRYQGAGTPKGALLLPLAHVQRALGMPGKVEEILVSNRGGATGGVARTSAVVDRLRPALAPYGLEAQPFKRDGLRSADKSADAFLQMFSTFGSFSIAAGILLIFLIFVMLAAERRTEMGVARAVGTRRGHLVEMFLFEGATYDLAAAAVGALLGIAVSFAMVKGIERAYSSLDIAVTFSIRWQSIVIAYTLGVLLTFAVVAFSAWRVSVLNIVTAVRNLPDPRRRLRRHRSLVGAVVLLTLGGLMVAGARSSAEAMPFFLGLSVIFIGLVPVLRALRVPERVAYTIAGLGIVAAWLMPASSLERFVPGAQMDFSLWVVGGLMIVLGATWVVIYNADALLGAAMAIFGRIRSLAAVLRVSMAYPLRTRLRTGMTLAMFTLVVFTLVVGITTPTSFIESQSNVATYGGGFDVRALTTPTSAVADIATTTRRALGPDAHDMRYAASVSAVPVKARQPGYGAFVDYTVRGVDDEFRAHSTYALGSRAIGYPTDRAVWDAIGRGGRLAVVDPWIVPHRRNWSFGAVSDLSLHGLFAEDRTFRPVPLDVRDPATGRVERFTAIGVLRDSMPLEMAGIVTSQRQATASFGDRAVPTMYLYALAPHVDPDHFAARLESVFLADGLQADSFRKLVRDNLAGTTVFLRLIEGFMGLGLIVGVAALGVIAARSVVERRQQIGVLRAIGFQASTVRLGFLLESGFLALTSIIVGSTLGLAMAYNVVSDAHRQATWPGVHLIVPWLNLALVFAAVMLVALVTTYLPARRASRVYAAEALRYE